MSGQRYHLCPVHGWERCYFLYNFGHGCTRSEVQVGIWKTKLVEMQ